VQCDTVSRVQYKCAAGACVKMICLFCFHCISCPHLSQTLLSANCFSISSSLL
jgi:hypothetical protein